jgi:predicted O-methyltransferase YrrM
VRLSLQEVKKDFRNYDISGFSHPGGWALHVDSCKFLATLIRKYHLKNVLEFGSGFSSLMIANEIKHSADHLLVSIDNSQYYSQIARESLVENNIKANIEFYTFPIRPRIYHKKILLFYAIPQGFWSHFNKFDLVLIDAPHHDFGREACFYEIFCRLKIGGIAIIDDANRRSMEMVYAKKWQRIFGDAISMTYLKDIGSGLSVITKLQDIPMGCDFSKHDILISSLKSARNFIRVLTYRNQH